MKKQLFATAAAVVLAFAVPAIATAGEGVVDLTYYNSNDIDVDAIAVGGAVVTEVGPLNLQLDGEVVSLDDGGGDNLTLSNATAHLFTRNDSYAFGAFLGVATVVGDGVYTLGLEGAKYYDQVTLSGSVSTTSDELDAIDDITTAAVDVTYFVNDNLALGADFVSLSGDAAFEDEAWGVHAEWKTASPVSLFAGYQKFNDSDVDAFSLGARFSFGGDTLKSRDRTGPSMKRGSARSVF